MRNITFTFSHNLHTWTIYTKTSGLNTNLVTFGLPLLCLGSGELPLLHLSPPLSLPFQVPSPFPVPKKMYGKHCWISTRTNNGKEISQLSELSKPNLTRNVLQEPLRSFPKSFKQSIFRTSFCRPSYQNGPRTSPPDSGRRECRDVSEKFYSSRNHRARP